MTTILTWFILVEHDVSNDDQSGAQSPTIPAVVTAMSASSESPSPAQSVIDISDEETSEQSTRQASLNSSAPSVVEVSDEEETLDQSTRQAPHNSDWIAPPVGSPPGRPMAPLPPNYSLNLPVNDFGFPPLIAHFLHILQVPSTALCAIDATHNYEIASWRGQFIAAGLSEDDAEWLEQVFLASFSKEHRDVLRAASETFSALAPSTSHSARFSMDTISSVSSLDNEE